MKTLLKIIGILVAVLIVILIGYDFYDRGRASSFVQRAKSIAVGDSKQKVRSILGKPTATSITTGLATTTTTYYSNEQPTKITGPFISGVTNETWAYGSTLNLRHPFIDSFPYFFPFRLAFLEPDWDGVEIKFGSSNKVTNILIQDTSSGK